MLGQHSSRRRGASKARACRVHSVVVLLSCRGCSGSPSLGTGSWFAMDVEVPQSALCGVGFVEMSRNTEPPSEREGPNPLPATFPCLNPQSKPYQGSVGGIDDASAASSFLGRDPSPVQGQAGSNLVSRAAYFNASIGTGAQCKFLWHSIFPGILCQALLQPTQII